MKRLILLVAASLILASPAFAWKEKVYRIEWSEWGLKDGMKSEQIAKQLDKNNVKYHKYNMRYNNYPFENAHFMIDTVSRWGITWDKVVIRTHRNILADVYYSRIYKDKDIAMEIAAILKMYFEEKCGFSMDYTNLDLFDGVMYSKYLHYSTDLYIPHYFSISVCKDISNAGYKLDIDIHSFDYNPWLM